MADLLAIYLRDHHAGATAGLELARRAAGSNRDSDYGPELERIAEQLTADREALEEIMAALGVRADALKDGAAWAGEKLGRLKLNGSWIGYSPLSRLLELEGLAIAVAAKLALWEALREVAGERLDPGELERLRGRAVDQRRRLEALRGRAAAEALGTG